MKKKITSMVLGIGLLVGFSAHAQLKVGSSGAPNTGAVLDASNTTATATTYKGVLLPQVALTATNVYGLNTAGSATAINGMVVYNTATAGSGSTAVTPGVYIWQGSVWQKVIASSTGSLADSSIYNSNGTLTSNRTVTQGANSLTFNGTGGVNLNSGNIGIGTTTPYAPLQLANTIANRKIVLYDVGTNAANDSAFYGLGINAGILRYQVATGGSHVFYNNKTELMRLNGTGALTLDNYGTDAAANGLITTAPTGYLAVAADGTIMQTANGSAPNIYTVDGSIVNDRTVTLNGHTINFLGSTGNFQFNATGNTFSTSANSLTMTETGDQFGAASLTLQNRTGQNGLLVTTGDLTTGASGLGVTDLLMQTQGNGTAT